MIIKINAYTKANGRSPVWDEVKKLSTQERAKVLGCLKCIEEMGLDCNRVSFRQLRGKLWEINDEI